jgi:hypothetical protein
MPTPKPKTKLIAKKLAAGGTSDRNAGLVQRTLRIIDQDQPHEDAVPQVNTPTLLGIGSSLTEQKTANANFANNIKIGQLAPTTLAPALDNKLAGAPQTTAPVPGAKLANVAGAVGGAVALAGDTLAGLKKQGPLNTWGIETQTTGGKRNDMASSALSSAGKWAGMGATVGSALGPVGTAIGAGVGLLGGAIAGLFKGKKKIKTEAKDYKDSTQAAYEGYNQKANAQQYAALAKCGAKLSIMHKLGKTKKDAISRKDRKFKPGGKLDKLGEVNVIPSGTLHKENNNLGQKDKGIPIIDGAGKKVFEVEREELILRLKTTKNVEDLVSRYTKSHNDKHLIDLGKLLSKEILTNTHDHSGRYGLEVT